MKTEIMVLQHGPHSLTLSLKTHRFQNWNSTFSQYDLWIILKGPWIFMITALGLCVKQPKDKGVRRHIILSCGKYLDKLLIDYMQVAIFPDYRWYWSIEVSSLALTDGDQVSLQVGSLKITVFSFFLFLMWCSSMIL